MEADIKKSRKTDCMRKKFKMHSNQMKEDMYSYDLMMPPDLTFIHNVLFSDFNRGHYEQDGGKEDLISGYLPEYQPTRHLGTPKDIFTNEIANLIIRSWNQSWILRTIVKRLGSTC